MIDLDIPKGFEPHFRKSPLTAPWEPIYSRVTDQAVIIGLRLAERHTNSRGLAHGGLISSLADNAMGLSCGHVLGGGTRLVTVSLTVDFIGAIAIGQWLQVETDVIKTGSTLCFAQCFVTADGVPSARASATFRVAPRRRERFKSRNNELPIAIIPPGRPRDHVVGDGGHALARNMLLGDFP